MGDGDSSVSKSSILEHISKELIDLEENVTDLSEYFKNASRKICSDGEDVVRGMETRNTLKIGRESVQPLVELKNVASEVFGNIRNSEVKSLHQEIDVSPFWIHINELKKMNNETRQIISAFGSLKDDFAKLVEQQKNQKPNTNADESCVSSGSISSDPSISEFSLFENSSTNAATSSPIRNE